MILLKWFERHFERKHIKEKIRFIYQKIWDLRLMREQLRAVRENIRQNYDYASEQLRGFNDAQKMASETNEDIEKLSTELSSRVESLKKDISTADSKIDETNTEINTHRQALTMFTNYLKSI